jgi:hypothetical protein
VAAGIDGSFEGDAHAFLASVYKNPRLPLESRIQAASRALRVEKPVPVSESPYHGLADALRESRKLALSQAETDNSVHGQTLLIGRGGSTDDRGENS